MENNTNSKQTQEMEDIINENIERELDILQLNSDLDILKLIKSSFKRYDRMFTENKGKNLKSKKMQKIILNIRYYSFLANSISEKIEYDIKNLNKIYK